MAQAATGPDAAQRLSERLDDVASRPLAERLMLVRQVAEQVGALHASGRFHGDIRPETLTLDAGARLQLSDPPARRRFGGDDADPDMCPPDLIGRPPLELPADMAVAARLLENGHRPIHPRRIDLYQLGVLLCRLLTGRSMRDYMTSPTVKSRVPSAALPCLSRAIGFDVDQPYEDCDALIAGLDEAMRSAASTPIPEHSADTWPPAADAGTAESEDTSPELEARDSSLADAESLPFRKLGHFEILALIGSGGMGDVYKGYDTSLRRVVAVKVLPPELAGDRDLVERFRSEAAAVARLNHPNLVSVYSTGEEQGRPFFAMRYVEGESLASLLERENRPPLDRSLAIVEQCLAGLQAAHAEGLIHRDIKPGNILIERDTGRAVLIDFGLVHRMDSATSLTTPGTVMGTVDYIAPEQARGQPIDARTDLYAIGVLLYRMLSGRLPFTGDTPTVIIYQHAHESARPLRDVAPDVPASLARIVQRLIDKDPARRYQTAAGALDDIGAFREGRPLAADRSPVGELARSAGRPYVDRRRALWIAGGTAAAALAMLTGVWQFSSPPLLTIEPGQALPAAQWVDALSLTDPSWDTVSGEWLFIGAELAVARDKYCRLMLPVEVQAGYDLKAEFTRVEGAGQVTIVFPVGARTCQLNLDNAAGHGLEQVDGLLSNDRLNPTSRRPGKLINGQRYAVMLSVTTEGDVATIDVTLNERALISWRGSPQSLSVLERWSLPKPFRPALAAQHATVTWHAAAVRAEGRCRPAPTPAPPPRDTDGRGWDDLLAEIDLEEGTVGGQWRKTDEGIAVAPVFPNERFARRVLPVTVEGSYDLLTEFTRTAGLDSVTVTLPVGVGQCTLHFSAQAGGVGGLERIDELNIVHQHNPAVRRPSGLRNGHRYQVLAQVRTHGDDAVIDVWLDGKPFVHWAGKQSSLSLDKAWSMPTPHRVGLGANQCNVIFHSLRLRRVGETAKSDT